VKQTEIKIQIPAIALHAQIPVDQIKHLTQVLALVPVALPVEQTEIKIQIHAIVLHAQILVDQIKDLTRTLAVVPVAIHVDQIKHLTQIHANVPVAIHVEQTEFKIQILAIALLAQILANLTLIWTQRRVLVLHAQILAKKMKN
jgi:hypothetical protein